MRTGLAIAIGIWTLIAWGGRIRLLTEGEGFGAWLRIAGSLLVGFLAVAALLVPRFQAARVPVLVVFSVFTVALWIRSLTVNWAGDGSLPFKLVHTVLALGFFALAWWALAFAVSPGSSVSSPETSLSRNSTS